MLKEMIAALKLKPQEQNGNYKFNSQVYITKGFISEFGDDAQILALAAITKIRKERVLTEDGADFLQVLKYKNTKFWAIDDREYVTILLPQEY